MSSTCEYMTGVSSTRKCNSSRRATERSLPRPRPKGHELAKPQPETTTPPHLLLLGKSIVSAKRRMLSNIVSVVRMMSETGWSLFRKGWMSRKGFLECGGMMKSLQSYQERLILSVAVRSGSMTGHNNPSHCQSQRAFKPGCLDFEYSVSTEDTHWYPCSTHPPPSIREPAPLLAALGPSSK